MTETGAGLTVALEQQRFFADPDAVPTGQAWPVPMVFRYGGADGSLHEARYLLAGRAGSVRLPGAIWYYPNAAGAGFYRTAFDDRSVALLASGIGALAPEERLSLLDNQWALARAGMATLGQVLQLVDAYRGESDLAVLRQLADVLGWVGHHVTRPTTVAAFRALVERIFRPELERLGWEPRSTDTPDELEARQVVLLALGRTAAAADVRTEAMRRITAHLDGVARLDPNVAGAIPAAAAAGADGGLYERYLERMAAVAKTDAQEEARFRNALADFEDPALATRTSQVIFSPVIRDQDRGLLLARLLGTRHGRGPGWAGIKSGWDAYIAKMDPLLKQRVVGAASLLTPRALATEAASFLRAHVTPDTQATVAQAIERLRVNAATAERMADELEDAFGRIAQPVR